MATSGDTIGTEIGIVGSPAILDDATFLAYGGTTGTSTVAQRQAAYTMAEGFAEQEIGTFLSPITVTGTYTWPPLNQPLQLEHTYLNSVGNVTAVHDAGCDCRDDAIEIEGCAWILDADGGTVSLRECTNTAKANCSGCLCGNSRYNVGPLQVQIAYTAGLPTSAASDPRPGRRLSCCKPSILNSSP